MWSRFYINLFKGNWTQIVSLDLNSEFLYFYNIRDLNPILCDIWFHPFKVNIFNAIISISAFQWIFRDIKNSHMRLKLLNLAEYF